MTAILTQTRCTGPLSYTRTRRGAHGLSLRDCALSGGAGGGGGPPTWAALPAVAGGQLIFCADREVYADAALTTPQTTPGATVKGWKDQSGGAHHATQTGGGTLRVGTEGGHNGIEFNNQWLATATITAPTTALSYLCVWRPVGDGNNFSGLLTRGNGNNGSLYFHNGTQVLFWSGASWGSTASYGSSNPLVISTVVRTGNSLSYWKNGTADAVNPLSIGGAMAATDAYGLGADTNGGEGGHKVLAAVLAYDNAISGADRLALHTFLGSYYGIPMGGS